MVPFDAVLTSFSFVCCCLLLLLFYFFGRCACFVCFFSVFNCGPVARRRWKSERDVDAPAGAESAVRRASHDGVAGAAHGRSARRGGHLAQRPDLFGTAQRDALGAAHPRHFVQQHVAHRRQTHLLHQLGTLDRALNVLTRPASVRKSPAIGARSQRLTDDHFSIDYIRPRRQVAVLHYTSWKDFAGVIFRCDRAQSFETRGS